MALAEVLEMPSIAGTDMLDHAITDERAWTRDTITPQDCVISIGQAGLDEVRRMTEQIECAPLPALLRTPDQFALTALREALGRARQLLDTAAPGVAVVDRLPMDEMPQETAIAISWVLGQLVGRPVAQKWDGTMLYDVKDTGQKYGYGVRGSYTNVELVFHTDNAFGLAQPSYVGLLCFYPALEGGLSRFCSLYSVHNRMLERYPEELARLYEPLLWDRQAEHAPGEAKAASAPMFAWDGERLSVRANTSLNEKGYKVAGEVMDARAHDALEALKEVTAEEDLWFELAIERGQIQYLNNIEVAHYRSEFHDHPEPEKKRHLVRTWHRDWGAVTYDG
jgi:hypothetical protein